MRLSISLIAVALAAIAGSAVAAPALYPIERTSFERDVDIYSRGTQSKYTEQHNHHSHQEGDKHAAPASQYTERHHRDHEELAKQADNAITTCSRATRLAVRAHDLTEAESQEMAQTEVERLHDKHVKLSRTSAKTEEHKSINSDSEVIKRKKDKAEEVIKRLGPWEKASYISPY